jgi:hypothetical protein
MAQASAAAAAEVLPSHIHWDTYGSNERIKLPDALAHALAVAVARVLRASSLVVPWEGGRRGAQRVRGCRVLGRRLATVAPDAVQPPGDVRRASRGGGRWHLAQRLTRRYS